MNMKEISRSEMINTETKTQSMRKPYIPTSIKNESVLGSEWELKPTERDLAIGKILLNPRKFLVDLGKI
jgi:hypothetical protein